MLLFVLVERGLLDDAAQNCRRLHHPRFSPLHRHCGERGRTGGERPAPRAATAGFLEPKSEQIWKPQQHGLEQVTAFPRGRSWMSAAAREASFGAERVHEVVRIHGRQQRHGREQRQPRRRSRERKMGGREEGAAVQGLRTETGEESGAFGRTLADHLGEARSGGLREELAKTYSRGGATYTIPRGARNGGGQKDGGRHAAEEELGTCQRRSSRSVAWRRTALACRSRAEEKEGAMTCGVHMGPTLTQFATSAKTGNNIT
uniref:Uncharacterized protein n=1 Tax=Oryza punctata TaxID=4537 RepID=A0A0E0JPT4_ORYPU